MAQENVAKLVELIRSDEALQAKLKEAFEAYDGPKDDERAVFEATIAPIAAEAGLPCTYEEGLGFATADRNLSDEELEAVAGGSGDNCLGDGGGVCYYVGWSTEGPDGWVCDDPLGGTLAGCVWLGVTIA